MTWWSRVYEGLLSGDSASAMDRFFLAGGSMAALRPVPEYWHGSRDLAHRVQGCSPLHLRLSCQLERTGGFDVTDITCIGSRRGRSQSCSQPVALDKSGQVLQ